jgi:hypothetical protein
MRAAFGLIVVLVACGCAASQEAGNASPVPVSGWLFIETDEGRSGETWDAVYEPGVSVHLPGCVLDLAEPDQRATCLVRGRPYTFSELRITELPEAGGVCVSGRGLWSTEALGEIATEISWCGEPPAPSL